MKNFFKAAVLSALITLAGITTNSPAQTIAPLVPQKVQSSSADTPAWKEYKKLLGNYYYLDKQKAAHISCRVSVPTTQGLIDSLRQKDGFVIHENLHDFSVTYDRTHGVSFNSPHIEVSFPPDAKLASVKQLWNVQEMLDEDFSKNINGAKKIITKQLAYMISPRPENYKILSLTKNGNATVVSFDDAKDKNAHYKVIYSGSMQKGTYSSPTSNLTYTIDYQPLNGNLALAPFSMISTEGSTKANSTESISYQDLGSAFFPAQFLIDATISEDTQQPKPYHFEIDLKDCKTSDLTEIESLRKAADQGNADAQDKLGTDYYSGSGIGKDYKEAVKWYRKAADQGNAEAQANIGAAYHEGVGVEKDFKEAVKWYRKAADQGDVDGQFLLGVAYSSGEGVEKNDKEAVNWLRKAADQGHARGQTLLGVAYANGKGVEKDYKEAAKWFRKAADQGDAKGQAFLGNAYAKGEGVEKNDKEAVNWYHKSADQGYAWAQCAMGKSYHYGIGVEKDDKQAVVWWRKAADQGNADAQESLKHGPSTANILAIGLLILSAAFVVKMRCDGLKKYNLHFLINREFLYLALVPPVLAGLLRTWATLTHHGIAPLLDARAFIIVPISLLLATITFNKNIKQSTVSFGIFYTLAQIIAWMILYLAMLACYFSLFVRDAAQSNTQPTAAVPAATVTGAAKDHKISIDSLRKAADQGDAWGQVLLGEAYVSGEGVKKDYKEAAKWMRKAADQGNATGQNFIGLSYHSGEGAEKNDKEAVKWYRKAADQGDASGQTFLGNAYAKGQGVEKNDKEAVKWFRKAADQDDALGQVLLGGAYAHGIGVEKDDKEAVKWIRKAADQGNVWAQFFMGQAYHEGFVVKKDDKQAVVWFRKAAEQGNAEAQKALKQYPAPSSPPAKTDR